jgi:hypothetical protein
MNLLITARRIATTARDAVRSVVNPTALVEAKATEAPAVEVAETPEPAGLYTEAELPPVEQIEAAAKEYDKAAEMRRRADRASRAAKKLITRLPSGRYGNWIVERVVSNRQTADLDKIRAIFKANGLGSIPMKDAQPSLKVRRAEVADVAPAELVAA